MNGRIVLMLLLRCGCVAVMVSHVLLRRLAPLLLLELCERTIEQARWQELVCHDDAVATVGRHLMGYHRPMRSQRRPGAHCTNCVHSTWVQC